MSAPEELRVAVIAKVVQDAYVEFWRLDASPDVPPLGEFIAAKLVNSGVLSPSDTPTEYEQVGWRQTHTGALKMELGEWNISEAWEPVFRRVRDEGSN